MEERVTMGARVRQQENPNTLILTLTLNSNPDDMNVHLNWRKYTVAYSNRNPRSNSVVVYGCWLVCSDSPGLVHSPAHEVLYGLTA